jgi:Uma2 family endonuclease
MIKPVTQPGLMTTEELLAMPDDGVERWLIKGQLREKHPLPEEQPGSKAMSIRNQDHSEITIAVGHFLEAWRRGQPEPRGRVAGGEAGVRLRRTPESTVGIDVTYYSAEVAERRTEGNTTLIDGAPVLAVEILSPNDTVAQTNEKIREYLDSGVQLIWVIDPDNRTVTIHRAGARPEMVNDAQELSGEPHLPGFRVRVAELFE